MANAKRKNAIRRLMQDLQEVNDEPVANVSAQPLDDNMLEWHCNFYLDDTVFHLILFFPDNYPYVSPSAEFVPHGYQFTAGATEHGKKGVKVCLSIFSDFAKYHTEWANEKGMGWSPGYTVQTVLLNLLSFLAETMEKNSANSWANDYQAEVCKKNRKLAQGFKCKDCGHTHAKPYPPVESEESKPTKPAVGKGKGKGKGKSAAVSSEADTDIQIVDYISKTKFDSAKRPKTKDELYGYGLIVSGPTHRPSLTTPCEFLTGDSFYGMKDSIGCVQSMMKEELKFFLPMYLNTNHGAGIKQTFEETMKELAQLLPSCKRKTVPEMVLKTLPNLMSATVVEFSKGEQHTSDNHLNGYFSLHRLFLWAVETYPELQDMIDEQLAEFISSEQSRTKKACPHLGEWLLLLTASAKYRWQQAADAYLSESWKRNVMWYVKDDAKLGFLDTEKKYRIEKTLEATSVSRKLLAFQVLFLDIAMPKDFSRQQILERYDKNHGFPTPGMVEEMKQAVQKINDMKTYPDWFKVLKLPVPTEEEIFTRLEKSVEYSINTTGYHWTFWKNQGGWAAVLKKYPNGTPGWIAPAVTPKASKGKAKGKAKETAAKENKKGGKKRKADEDASEDEEEEEKPAKGKGRGGKKMKTEDTAVNKKAPKGRGAAKRKAVEEVEEVEEVKPKGRGGKKAKIEEESPKGRGRGKAAAGKGRGRGRGKAR